MCMPLIPVIVLFFQSRGLSIKHVLLLQAIFSGVLVILEIPSGWISDVMGRRLTMIAGCIAEVSGFVLYPFAYSFMDFVVVETLLAIGISLISGTDSALLYDTLLELGEAEQGIREEGRQLSFGHYSEAIAAVVGGLLAAVSLQLPVWIQAIWMLMILPPAFMLVEPAVQTTNRRTSKPVDMFRTCKRVIAHGSRLRWLMITSSVLGCSTLTFVWIAQPWLMEAGLPLWAFGILWAMFMVIVGISASNAHRVETHFDTKYIIAALGAGVVIAYLAGALWTVLWVIPIFTIFHITRGISNPIFTNTLNIHTSSAERATVLSIRQFGTRLSFVCVGPVVGYIADGWGLQAAMIFCAILFAAALAVSITMWTREGGGQATREAGARNLLRTR